jgi:hypothetical protein
VATSSRTGAKTWRLPHEIELDRTTVLSADRGDLAWEHELVPSFREGTAGCRRGGGRFFLQNLRLAHGLSARVVRTLS